MTTIYTWGKIISPSFQPIQTDKQNPIKYFTTDQSIKSIKCGKFNAFILNQNHQLYGFGSNQKGQLGLGYNLQSKIPISKVFLPTKKKIVDISCGWYHTLILDQLGDVYSTGSGEDGAIGQGGKEDSYGFKLILNHAQKISAGRDHSLAVVRNNKVFGWGNTQQGQLGLHSKKRFYSPHQLNIYPCQQIFAGPKYSIFITVKGVYGCGMNNNYQLGLGHQKNLHYPKKIQINSAQFQQKIIKIQGSNYIFATTNHNQCYIWGTGAFGIYKYPTKINFFNNCDKVSFGQTFGMMKKKQKIYVWGSNNYGELGFISEQGKDYAFESQQLNELKLMDFCCGQNFAVGISHENVKQKHYQAQNLSKSYSKKYCQSQKDKIIEKDNSAVGQDFDENHMNIQNRSKNSFYSSFSNHNHNKRMLANRNNQMPRYFQQKDINSWFLNNHNGGKGMNFINNVIKHNKNFTSQSQKSDQKTLKRFQQIKQSFQFIKKNSNSKSQAYNKNPSCYTNNENNFNSKKPFQKNHPSSPNEKYNTMNNSQKLNYLLKDMNQIKLLLKVPSTQDNCGHRQDSNVQIFEDIYEETQKRIRMEQFQDKLIRLKRILEDVTRQERL